MSDVHFIHDEPAPPRRRGSRVTKLMVWVLVLGGGIGLAIRWVDRAREAAREAQCVNNLSQIALALLNYHATYDCYPPAYIADATGKPMHSWRMLIAPFLESSPLWSQYNYAEPWDGPNNTRLLGGLRNAVYHCPSHGDNHGQTSYVMIVGPKTASPGARSIRIGDIRDGVEQTILIAEVDHLDIPWYAPRDLDAASMSWVIDDPKRPSISSPHPGGPAVVFADGTVIRLSPLTLPDDLKAMITIDGGEPTYHILR